MEVSNPQALWRPEDNGRGAPGADYHLQWKAFGLRRNLALFLLYGWVPVCVGLFWWSRLSIHQPVACVIAMGIWLACALTGVWWAGEFRCPRCRRRYGALGHRRGGTNLTRGLWDRVCSNCKLTKFENVR
jgi:hypothetical protein